jgi:hypothetical protein
MDDRDLQLDDAVLFELPTGADADALCALLRPRWPGWSDEEDGVWLVSAQLGDGVDELALLLREAQGLLEELGLPAIRFHLDGGLYLLRASRRLVGA